MGRCSPQDGFNVRQQEGLEAGAHPGRVLDGKDTEDFVALAGRTRRGDAVQGHGRGTRARGGETKGRGRRRGPGRGGVWVGSQHGDQASAKRR